MNKSMHVLSLLLIIFASCSSDDQEENAPLFKEVNINGVIWMDRNMGAKSPEDFGGYYQWGRPADGHQVIGSETTSTLSSGINPGNGKFILNTHGESWMENPIYDIGKLSNVCPDGWRLPTASEYEELIPFLEFGEKNGVKGAIYKDFFLPKTGSRSGDTGKMLIEEDYPLDPVVRNVCTNYQTSSVSIYKGGGSLMTFDFLLEYEGGYSFRTSTTGVFVEGLPVRCVKK